MKYKLDSEVASALSALAAQTGAVPVPKRGDWKALRDRGNAMHALWAAASPSYPNVEMKSFYTESNDGTKIELRWYEKKGSKPVAAPARLKDFSGLAPAYIEVGELDIFRDEAVAYGQQLALANVPIELHVHSGAPHGFERFAPSSKLAMRAMNDRMRTVVSI